MEVYLSYGREKDIENQGSVGKCAAMAVCELMEDKIFVLTGTRPKLSYDFLYGYRGVGYTRGEPANHLDCLKTISLYGIPLESDFTMPNTPYPLIDQHIEEVLINKEIMKRASKYKFKLRYSMVKTMTEIIDLLSCGHSLLGIELIDKGAGHLMVLCGIKKINDMAYELTYSNSWGGNGEYKQVLNGIKRANDIVFPLENDIIHVEILNPSIIKSDKVPNQTVFKFKKNSSTYYVNDKKKRIMGYSPSPADIPEEEIKLPVINGVTFVPLKAIVDNVHSASITYVPKSDEIIVLI